MIDEVQNRRRFQVIDGLILVATTAGGLAMARSVFRTWDYGSVIMPRSVAQRIGEAIWYGEMAVMPLVLSSTLGVLAVRVRRPPTAVLCCWSAASIGGSRTLRASSW